MLLPAVATVSRPPAAAADPARETRPWVPPRQFLAAGHPRVEPPEDFKYGEYDGHHTYYEGNEGNFWESMVKEYQAAELPTGFQGLISWLFFPAILAGLALNVPGEYLFIGAGLFTVVFCAIEMGKPDEPHHFEPEIYNMDR
ncbi:hypothetical protein AXF42_Ash014336 [Apostasia shenzhenica]|uniref:Photosynthetic NDH subunit of subcomplex B 5, chloroplastic n=1 Tax=Apostasia shenzhenica TaxID=1088818 RepID=A0A2I0B0W8_9ASPA|nr:hypothetical protein AXF42_Ash014336 [Apostasia shenzhenica]